MWERWRRSSRQTFQVPLLQKSSGNLRGTHCPPTISWPRKRGYPFPDLGTFRISRRCPNDSSKRGIVGPHQVPTTFLNYFLFQFHFKTPESRSWLRETLRSVVLSETRNTLKIVRKFQFLQHISLHFPKSRNSLLPVVIRSAPP